MVLGAGASGVGQGVPADWHSLRGKPLFSRATLGLLRPRHKILGGIAGQVEAVGDDVNQFKAGDEVYTGS